MACTREFLSGEESNSCFKNHFVLYALLVTTENILTNRNIMLTPGPQRFQTEKERWGCFALHRESVVSHTEDAVTTFPWTLWAGEDHRGLGNNRRQCHHIPPPHILPPSDGSSSPSRAKPSKRQSTAYMLPKS